MISFTEILDTVISFFEKNKREKYLYWGGWACFLVASVMSGMGYWAILGWLGFFLTVGWGLVQYTLGLTRGTDIAIETMEDIFRGKFNYYAPGTPVDEVFPVEDDV